MTACIRDVTGAERVRDQAVAFVGNGDLAPLTMILAADGG
jgi:hypothetical protein